MLKLHRRRHIESVGARLEPARALEPSQNSPKEPERDELGQPVSPFFYRKEDPQYGRNPGYWKTRYLGDSAKGIRFETIYLTALFLVTLILLMWLFAIRNTQFVSKEGVVSHLDPEFRLYSYAFLGGILGGWMFTLKWLVHAVTSWKWDQDRRLWRMLNPVLAGVLAFVFYAAVRSNLFAIFDGKSMTTGSAALTLGFLVGYFSDRAIGKLGDIADTVFGSRHGINPKDGKDVPKGKVDHDAGGREGPGAHTSEII